MAPAIDKTRSGLERVLTYMESFTEHRLDAIYIYVDLESRPLVLFDKEEIDPILLLCSPTRVEIFFNVFHIHKHATITPTQYFIGNL